MRSSPGNGASRPPPKKKVTCAYFSVSAMRNWVSPAATQFAQACRAGRRAGTRPAPAVGVVFGQADEARQPRPTRLEAGEGRIDERGGELSRAVGAEVHEHHRVAVLGPARRRRSRSAARTRRSRRGYRPLPAPDRIRACSSLRCWRRRSRPTRGARGPSGCRGPSRSSAADRGDGARCRSPRTRLQRAQAGFRGFGGMSRPSRKACTATCGTPRAAPVPASRTGGSRGCARRRARAGRAGAVRAPVLARRDAGRAQFVVGEEAAVLDGASMRVRSW